MTELFTDTVLNMMTTTAEPEDYTGEDGLLYCGKCRTAKEAYFPKETAAWLGHDKHPTECDCQREKRLECESADELPLIETPVALSEEEFLALPEFRSLIASGENPVIRLVCRGVKHVLSHRVIYANLYEVALPEDTKSFASFQRIRLEELDKYAISKLVQTLIQVIGNK